MLDQDRERGRAVVARTDLVDLVATGLNDDTTPLLDLECVCRLCGAVVARSSFDVSVITPAVAAPALRGALDATEVVAHLKTVHMVPHGG